MGILRLNILAFLLFTGMMTGHCYGEINTYFNGSDTWIQGVISNPISKRLKLSLPRNVLHNDDIYFEIELDERNSFEINFQLSSPSYATLHYMEDEMPLYVEPGNRIEIYFSAEEMNTSLYFKGDGQIHNNYLKQSQFNFKKLSHDYLLETMTRTNPETFKLLIKESAKSKRLYLEHFIKENSAPFNQEFLDYAYDEIRYWELYYMLLYTSLYEPFQNFSTELTDEERSFLTFLEILEFKLRANYQSPWFERALDQYLDILKRASKYDKISISKEITRFTIAVPTVAIYSSADLQSQPIGQLQEGNSLLFLNKIEERYHHGELIRWLRVEQREKNLIGWIPDSKIKMRDTWESIYDFPTRIGFKTEEKEGYVLTTIKHNASLYGDLHNKTVLTSLDADAELIFLNERSIEEKEFRVENDTYKDSYYLVKTKDDQIGWVFGGDVFMAKDLITQVRIREQFQSFNPHSINTMSTFLEGEVLEFAVARNLERVLQESSGVVSEQDLAEYFNGSLNSQYVSIIRSYLTEKDEEEILSYTDNLSIRAEGNESLSSISSEQRQTGETRVMSINRNTGKERGTIDVALETEVRRITRIKLIGDIGENSRIIVRSNKVGLVNKPVRIQEGEAEIAHEEALEINLSYIGGDVDIYCIPGDIIEVKNSNNGLIIKDERGDEINKHYVNLQKSFSGDDFTIRSRMKYSAPADFLDYIAMEFDQRMAFVNSIVDDSISLNTRSNLQEIISTWYISELLSFHNDSPMLPPDVKDVLKVRIKDVLDELNEGITGNILTKDAQDYARQLIRFQQSMPENRYTSELELVRNWLRGNLYHFSTAAQLSKLCRLGLGEKYKGEINDWLASESAITLKNEVRRAYVHNSPNLMVGFEAPELNLIDHRGRKVTLDDLEGKLVYIDFWATWCRPCLMHLESLQKKIPRYEGRDIEFVFVSLDNSPQRWQNYLNRTSMKGVQAFAPGGLQRAEVARKYKIENLPAQFLIDKTGKILWSSLLRDKISVYDIIEQNL